MKNINQGQEFNRNQETYQKFINKISQVTKSNKTSTNQQNRSTVGSSAIEIKSEIYTNQINPSKFEENDEKEKQRQIYEKMNQHLLNRRRNAEWGQNQNYNTNFVNNGKNNSNPKEIEQNKVFYDMKNTGHFNRDSENSTSQYQYQSKNINMINDNNIPQVHQHHTSNNNYYNPFKTNVKNVNNFQSNKNINYKYSNNNSNKYSYQNNEFSDNIPENSNISANSNQHNKFLENSNNDSNYNNNSKQNVLNLNDEEISNNPKKSGLCSSLLYGLIFGSFGTLLLWFKNPKVREYLKNCYQNINTESILNFFKMFLHPIDLIKKIGNNIGNLGEIIKQSLKYLYDFIEEYSDLWRLLGIIVMVYALWLIIKKIFKLSKKSKNKKKKEIIKEYKVQFIQ